MARIEDLIAGIPDEELREAFAREAKTLKKTKRFGFAFEEHLPETRAVYRQETARGILDWMFLASA